MNHQMLLENVDTISLFVIALGMAFSHCYGMCGGIVLAFSQNLPSSFWGRLFLHLLYNTGRISTYVIIGIACAHLGAKFSVSDSARGGIFIILGFLMGLLGAGYLIYPKILHFLEPNIGGFGIFKKAFGFFMKQANPLRAYLLGFLNGLLPCGIVYFFAMNAMIAASDLRGIHALLKGAEIMLIFGVASAIPMLLLGSFSAILAISKFKNIFVKISAFLIIIFGVWTMMKGFGILFK
ncbi:sulfite exporter TauE/SafE family protein [Helicobacter sp. 23-1045]